MVATRLYILCDDRQAEARILTLELTLTLGIFVPPGDVSLRSEPTTYFRWLRQFDILMICLKFVHQIGMESWR